MLVILLLATGSLILGMRNGVGKVSPAGSNSSGGPRTIRGSADPSFLEISRRQQPPLDWKRLCEIADEESAASWLGWNEKTARHRQRLEGMPLDSLLDLLSKIPDLACSEAATHGITNLVMHAIIAKNPAIGFDLAMDRFNADPGFLYPMSSEFQEWVESDPEAAEQWLARQDWGQVVGFARSELAGMCSNILTHHLNCDIGRAEKFVRSLPVAERYGILQYGFINSKHTFDNANAASLVRRSLPEDERARMFGEIYEQGAVFGDYQKIETVLQTISASAEERSEIVVAVSKARMGMGTGKPPQESLDEIRGWVGKVAPEVLDRTTGEILSVVYDHELGHKETENLILKYLDAGAGDDLIFAFLKSEAPKKSAETIQRFKGHLRNGSDGVLE